MTEFALSPGISFSKSDARLPRRHLARFPMAPTKLTNSARPGHHDTVSLTSRAALAKSRRWRLRTFSTHSSPVATVF
jgi:hypothetical protein